jgi:hypothetical protein
MPIDSLPSIESTTPASAFSMDDVGRRRYGRLRRGQRLNTGMQEPVMSKSAEQISAQACVQVDSV